MVRPTESGEAAAAEAAVAKSDAETLAYWLDLFAGALDRRGHSVEATLVGAAALSLRRNGGRS